MGFKVTTKKLPVDEQALASFAAGADSHQITPAQAPLASTSIEQEGKLTESMLFRCTKATMDEFNFVFEHTNVKSKQKLLEAILLPELRRRAAELRSKG